MEKKVKLLPWAVPSEIALDLPGVEDAKIQLRTLTEQEAKKYAKSVADAVMESWYMDNPSKRKASLNGKAKKKEPEPA